MKERQAVGNVIFSSKLVEGDLSMSSFLEEKAAKILRKFDPQRLRQRSDHGADLFLNPPLHLSTGVLRALLTNHGPLSPPPAPTLRNSKKEATAAPASAAPSLGKLSVDENALIQKLETTTATAKSSSALQQPQAVPFAVPVVPSLVNVRRPAAAVTAAAFTTTPTAQNLKPNAARESDDKEAKGKLGKEQKRETKHDLDNDRPTSSNDAQSTEFRPPAPHPTTLPSPAEALARRTCPKPAKSQVGSRKRHAVELFPTPSSIATSGTTSANPKEELLAATASSSSSSSSAPSSLRSSLSSKRTAFRCQHCLTFFDSAKTLLTHTCTFAKTTSSSGACKDVADSPSSSSNSSTIGQDSVTPSFSSMPSTSLASATSSSTTPTHAASTAKDTLSRHPPQHQQQHFSSSIVASSYPSPVREQFALPRKKLEAAGIIAQIRARAMTKGGASFKKGCGMVLDFNSSPVLSRYKRENGNE
eukprot:jgi/Bigna1/77350/fgenesh1_pg.47_\